MDKIGIFTFHDAHNYGAVLQAMGLKHHLESQGFEVHFFRLDQRFPWKYHVRKGLQDVRNLLRKDGLAHYRLREQYNQVFRDYIERHLPCIEVRNVDDLTEISKDYKAFVVGSDQIWNTNMGLLYGEALRWFFLDVPLHCRKISYAASFGVQTQPEEKRSVYAPMLRSFDSISVRDEFSANLVVAAGCPRPEIVCDPTFLFDFRTITEKPRPESIPQSPYIFTYCLNKENEADYRQILDQLKDRLGLPIVTITSFGHTEWELPGCDRSIRDASPGDWVWLIENSSFVFTDSFHGTIFSIICGIPFLSFSHASERGNRTLDLASKLGFEMNLISADSILPDKQEKVPLPTELITLSKQFILNSISAPR